MSVSDDSPGRDGGSSDQRQAADELLKRARRAREQADKTGARLRRKRGNTTFGRASRHLTDIHEGLGRVGAVISWFYAKLVAPLLSRRWLGAPLRAYGWLWNKVVFVEDGYGDPMFAKGRASLMVVGTLVGLWLLPGFLAGTAEVFWDTGQMAFTYKSGEIWYLGKSQEIDPEGNVFSAQGCESISCTDQTSIYFRIKPSVAHHVWSMIHNGNLFFPDFVSGGIQNDVNKCKVTGYGARWKFLVRNWDVYPQILSVECVPVTESDIEGAQDGAG